MPRPSRRGARALFAQDVWPAVRALLERRTLHLLVAFDLDGTLAPIVSRPERAAVPGTLLSLLGRATRIPRVTVAVITARGAREAARLLPLRRVVRATSYGLEGVDRPSPAERHRWARAAATISSRLAPIAAEIPGAWVEPKGIMVAIHDRAVAPGRLPRLRRSLRRAARLAASLGFRAIAGRRVTEFAPRCADKARALAALRRSAADDVVFYFGDSEEDERVFRSLGPGSYSVRVGPGPTSARFRIDGTRGVSRFVRALVSIRDPRP